MRSLALVVLIHCTIAHATAQQPEPDSKPATPQNATETPTDDTDINDSLDEWVDQLGSPRFAIRNQAARQLKASGLRGIKTLQRVASSGDADASEWAFKILEEHFRNKTQPAVQKAAKQSLEVLAADEKNPNASIAKGILNEEENRKSPPKNVRQMFVPPQLHINGGFQMRIQVKNNNGKLQIEQEKNGEKTRITESEDGIEVEKKDAKGNATKKTYKNVEDLKQKDKSAHELFQKHKKMGAGFRIQMNGNGNLMPFKAQPFKIPNARQKNPEQNKEKSGAEDNRQKFHEQTLKRHRDMMEMQLRTLEKIKENAPEQQRKQLDELFKRQSDLMNQQLRELERNLKPEQKPEPDSKPQPPAEAETPATQESGEKKPATAPSTQPEKEPGKIEV